GAGRRGGAGECRDRTAPARTARRAGSRRGCLAPSRLNRGANSRGDGTAVQSEARLVAARDRSLTGSEHARTFGGALNRVEVSNLVCRNAPHANAPFTHSLRSIP